MPQKITNFPFSEESIPELESLLARYVVLSNQRPNLYKAFQILLTAFKDKKKLLVCGNGGSASDAEHIVGELLKSFKKKRAIPREYQKHYETINGEPAPLWLEGALPAISLVSQSSFGTAFINDKNAEGCFAQQVYAYGRRGDVLWAISTSGNSSNVVAAAKIARASEVKVISLTGSRNSQLEVYSDVCIKVPEFETYKIQELHLPVYHAICAALEESLFDS